MTSELHISSITVTATIGHKENHNNKKTKKTVTSCCVTCTTQVPYKYFNHSYYHAGVISPTQQFVSSHLWAQALWKMFNRLWIIIVNKGTDAQILLMLANSRKVPGKHPTFVHHCTRRAWLWAQLQGWGHHYPWRSVAAVPWNPTHTPSIRTLGALNRCYIPQQNPSPMTIHTHTHTQSTTTPTKTQNGVLTLIITGWRIYELFSA